ncbi:unnamed protein product, partial [Prorocentrum cordatum]
DVMNYVDGTKWEDRYLCGPRLVARLSGPAATACIGRPRGWLSNNWGADRLLEYLQKNVMRQPVEDVGHYMGEYFVKLRRKCGESMGEYCLRVHERYQRLRVALASMIGKTETMQTPATISSFDKWPEDSGTASWYRVPGGEEGTADDQEAEEVQDWKVPGDEDHGRWYRHGWTSGGWWQHQWGQRDQDDQSGCTFPTQDLPEVLPSIVRGWYLLHRAGLDGGEIAAVIGSCRGDFTVESVESALRTQWPSDENLKERDCRKSKFIRQQVAAAAFNGEDAQTWNVDDDKESVMASAVANNVKEDGDDEGDDEAFATAMDEEEEAFAQFQASHKRLQVLIAQEHVQIVATAVSLEAVQEVQEVVSLDGDKFNGLVLMAAAMTDDGEEALNNSVDLDDPEIKMACVVSRATESGHGIIDSGATNTIGGIEAIENLNEILAKRGHPPMEIDLNDRPVFKFGNGEVKRVLCKVKFSLLVGGTKVSIMVHAVEAPGIPILVSIETLNNLGAVIDFEASVGIFKRIDSTEMISFPRSRTGHLLIDLTCDLLGEELSNPGPADCILSRGVAALADQTHVEASADTGGVARWDLCDDRMLKQIILGFLEDICGMSEGIQV